LAAGKLKEAGIIMKTLIVYYSKTGNTKKVAGALVSELAESGEAYDSDELTFDGETHEVTHQHDPADYSRIFLLSPIWGLEPSEPMKIYLGKFGGSIKNYSLIFTCGLIGLSTCKRYCRGFIGADPVKAVKIKSGDINKNKYSLKGMV